MKVGYHGHEQQTPTFWDTALGQSSANALNLDFGHYIAAGNSNALEFVKEKSKHIVSMHMKDRKTKLTVAITCLGAQAIHHWAMY